MLAAAFIRCQAASTTRRALMARSTHQTRFIHVTPPVLKKKKAAEIDDLFDDLEIVDESLQKQQQNVPKTPTASSSTSTTVKRKLTPEERQTQFNEIVSFIKPRVGRKPQITGSEARSSSWLQLLQLARTEENLREVVELMPQWKTSGRAFSSAFPYAFVRRCQELDVPKLALEVFGDFAKYNVSLDLAAGRQLLHSLHRHPIEDLMTASALYGLYGLPPVSQDFVSCSIIVAACLRHNTPHSNTIAEALIPHLRELKAKTPVDVQDKYHRENVWVKMAVRSINHSLQKSKQSDIGDLVTTPAKEATVSA